MKKNWIWYDIQPYNSNAVSLPFFSVVPTYLWHIDVELWAFNEYKSLAKTFLLQEEEVHSIGMDTKDGNIIV